MISVAKATTQLSLNKDLESEANTRSSEEEHKVNALALGADEGRDKLRKATGSRK